MARRLAWIGMVLLSVSAACGDAKVPPATVANAPTAEVPATMPVEPAVEESSMFSESERKVLAEHGLAVYRDKLILDARPPITDAEVAAVERQIGTKVPAGLLELWRVSYGGRLDYDLSVPLGEHVYSASLSELFWPGSDGYRDLVGWIEHEKELHAEAAGSAEARAVLPALPFGGFEYLERVYVITQGAEHGRVLIYAQGLPAAWKGELTEDTVAPLAASVAELFDQLELTKDPSTADPESYPSGLEMVEAIDALRKDDAPLAERLDGLVKASIFDWRGLVESGAFAKRPRQLHAARLALIDASNRDDVGLLDTLVRHGYPLDVNVVGSATALSYAVGKGAKGVANRLLDSGRPLGETTIIFAENLDVALVDRLVEAGVAFDVEAVLSAAKSGSIDAAVRIAGHAKRHGDWGDLAAAIAKDAARERTTADQIEAGTMGSYATPAQHREHAARLEELGRRL